MNIIFLSPVEQCIFIFSPWTATTMLAKRPLHAKKIFFLNCMQTRLERKQSKSEGIPSYSAKQALNSGLLNVNGWWLCIKDSKADLMSVSFCPLPRVQYSHAELLRSQPFKPACALSTALPNNNSIWSSCAFKIKQNTFFQIATVFFFSFYFS